MEFCPLDFNVRVSVICGTTYVSGLKCLRRIFPKHKAWRYYLGLDYSHPSSQLGSFLGKPLHIISVTGFSFKFLTHSRLQQTEPTINQHKYKSVQPLQDLNPEELTNSKSWRNTSALRQKQKTQTSYSMWNRVNCVLSGLLWKCAL